MATTCCYISCRWLVEGLTLLGCVFSMTESNGHFFIDMSLLVVSLTAYLLSLCTTQIVVDPLQCWFMLSRCFLDADWCCRNAEKWLLQCCGYGMKLLWWCCRDAVARQSRLNAEKNPRHSFSYNAKAASASWLLQLLVRALLLSLLFPALCDVRSAPCDCHHHQLPSLAADASHHLFATVVLLFQCSCSSMMKQALTMCCVSHWSATLLRSSWSNRKVPLFSMWSFSWFDVVLCFVMEQKRRTSRWSHLRKA